MIDPRYIERKIDAHKQDNVVPDKKDLLLGLLAEAKFTIQSNTKE